MRYFANFTSRNAWWLDLYFDRQAHSGSTFDIEPNHLGYIWTFTDTGGVAVTMPVLTDLPPITSYGSGNSAVVDSRTVSYPATTRRGWWTILNAEGSDVTVGPDDDETINGEPSLVIPQGQWALLYADGEDWRALLSGGSGGSGGSAGPNVLPNGGFQVAQRGDGPFTSATTHVNNDGAYLLDGCVLLSDGNDVADIARVASSDFVSGRALEVDIETANKKLGFLFPVETLDIQEMLKTGAASVSCKAKQSSGTTIGAIRMHLLGWTGTADAPTKDVVSAWNAAGADFTPVANWAILGTATLSLSGSIQTVELENVDVTGAAYTNLAVFVVIDDTTLTVADKCLIGDVRLEPGATANAFVCQAASTVLQRCLRYFQIYGGVSSALSWAAYAGTAQYWVATLVFAAMLKTPTATVRGTWNTTNVIQTAPIVTGFTPNCAQVAFQVTTGPGYGFIGTNSADDLVELSAELGV